MAKTTDNIEMTERSKALTWMNNLIKNYRTEFNNVQASNGKIVYNAGLYRHSIELKEDRFLVDGNEVFIDSELWDKYVKLRELTGSIFVRAPKKIAFPYDWSNLSDEQVLENVRYLRKNAKKYNRSFKDGVLYMDNVKIHLTNDIIDNQYVDCVIINNKKHLLEGESDTLYYEIYDLYHDSKDYVSPARLKVQDWWNANAGNVVLVSGIVTACVLAAFVGRFVGKKCLEAQEQYKQKIINEAIEKYKQEQQKTINYNDSIEQNIR
ncbi:MAG: hypothetical protein IKZ49_04090 [Alphaproteobacteria bacterium]|nr:hypothetical protein [Alphaproteobacteria bacterium]